MSAPENELTRTLTRQAEEFARLGGSDVRLDEVLARAGEIRRGRRMRASMVMAAVVLAVAVPVGITVLGDADPAKKKAPSIAATKPDTSDVTLGDLPSGKTPRTGYFIAGTLFGPDDRYLSPTLDPVDLARLDGGWLATNMTTDSDFEEVSFVPQVGGSPRHFGTSASNIAVSGDGNVGAFVRPDGSVVAVEDGGNQSFTVGKVPGSTSYSVAGVDGESCNPDAKTGCTIYVNTADATSKVFAVSSVPGSDASAPPSIVSLDDVSVDGLFAGLVSVNEDGVGGCSDVLAPDGTKRFGSCDVRFTSFSPSGRYVLAEPFGDGVGPRAMSVYDVETGKPVLELHAKGDATFLNLVWEDDSHVLAVLNEGLRSAVLRIEVNGYREYAVAPHGLNDPYDSSFVLAVR